MLPFYPSFPIFLLAIDISIYMSIIYLHDLVFDDLSSSYIAGISLKEFMLREYVMFDLFLVW